MKHGIQYQFNTFKKVGSRPGFTLFTSCVYYDGFENLPYAYVLQLSHTYCGNSCLTVEIPENEVRTIGKTRKHIVRCIVTLKEMRIEEVC